MKALLEKSAMSPFRAKGKGGGRQPSKNRNLGGDNGRRVRKDRPQLPKKSPPVSTPSPPTVVGGPAQRTTRKPALQVSGGSNGSRVSGGNLKVLGAGAIAATALAGGGYALKKRRDRKKEEAIG